jgi:hypothetical protein
MGHAGRNEATKAASKRDARSTGMTLADAIYYDLYGRRRPT